MAPKRSRFAPPRLRVALAAAGLAVVAAVPAAAEVVFSTDFSSGIPAQVTGAGVQVEPAQGLTGLGAPGRQFGGNVLRYHTQAIHETTLSLTDLPAHTQVSVGFLLALIDSWDGTELMEVLVDGQLLFSHWFQLATGDASSYIAPAGGLLSSGVNLGWSAGSYYSRDRALDLYVEPVFNDIPHTASTLTVTFRLGAIAGGAAANWQGEMDESWAIDQLSVSVSNAASDVPPAVARAALMGNAPNPFNPSTRIFFVLPEGGADATLAIHDLRGRLLRVLADGRLPGGEQSVTWDGRDGDGRLQPAGVYLCRLEAPGVAEARPLTLVK